MRAVITGGLGFIGSHLTERLVREGHTVHVIDDGRTGNTLAGGSTLTREDVRWAGTPSADVIYHLAGPVGPVGVLSRAGGIVDEVVGCALAVRRWALANGCPLVYVSTSEVYGLQAQPMTEQAPRIIAAGHSARMEYAVAKMAAETLLLTVYQPGTQRRAFTHVLDIVDGIVRAAERGRPGEAYNLGNPANECSIWDLAANVLDLLRPEGQITVVDPRDLWGPAFHEAPDKVPDITKARTELGWEPTRDRATVIRDAAA